jgi:hypothetical protein
MRNGRVQSNGTPPRWAFAMIGVAVVINVVSQFLSDDWRPWMRLVGGSCLIIALVRTVRGLPYHRDGSQRRNRQGTGEPRD